MKTGKAVKLYNSITNIQDEIIEEAQMPKRKEKNAAWVKWGTLAACLCIVMIGVVRIFIDFIGNQAIDRYRIGILEEDPDLADISHTFGGNLLTQGIDLETATSLTTEFYYDESGNRNNIADWYSLLIFAEYPDYKMSMYCLFNENNVNAWKANSVFTKDNTVEKTMDSISVLQARADDSLLQNTSGYQYVDYVIFEYDNVVYDIRTYSNKESTMDDVLSDIQKALQDELATDVPSEYDFAPSAFLSSEGWPVHQFDGPETVDFHKKISFDGKYCIFFTAWGGDDVQIQVDSDSMELKNETIYVPVDSDAESDFWKLLDLTKGEYAFTAENLGEGESNIMAVIGLVQELEEPLGTIQGNWPATYLCSFSDDIRLNYKFSLDRSFSNSIEYGPVVAFYSADDCEWIRTIEMKREDMEVNGSIDLPAGNVIIRFLVGSWNIDMSY